MSAVKKYLFLDLDGVINSLEYNVGMEHIERDRRYRMDDCDPVKVGLLRFVLQATNANVVISSSWRIGRTPDWFKGYFEHVGIPSPPIVGCTPETVVGRENGIGRGDEVDAWLEYHHPGYKTDPSIVYAIVDDDGDFYEWQPFVQTSFLTGLTLPAAIRLIDYLGAIQTDDNLKRINSLRKHIDFEPYM